MIALARFNLPDWVAPALSQCGTVARLSVPATGTAGMKPLDVGGERLNLLEQGAGEVNRRLIGVPALDRDGKRRPAGVHAEDRRLAGVVVAQDSPVGSDVDAEGRERRVVAKTYGADTRTESATSSAAGGFCMASRSVMT